jgi:uncharacterized protein (DUF2141 family)
MCQRAAAVKRAGAKGDFGHLGRMTTVARQNASSSAVYVSRHYAGLLRETTMKTLIAMLCATLFAAGANAATLQVQIKDVNVASGTLMIKLVNSQEGYSDKVEPVAARMVEISKTGDVSVHFADLKPGTYAIMIMHDENNNGKLDSNILGIPKEGYGFSNNPRVMRQPTYEEAKFEVAEGDQSISIDLI